MRMCIECKMTTRACKTLLVHVKWVLVHVKWVLVRVKWVLVHVKRYSCVYSAEKKADMLTNDCPQAKFVCQM